MIFLMYYNYSIVFLFQSINDITTFIRRTIVNKNYFYISIILF